MPMRPMTLLMSVMQACREEIGNSVCARSCFTSRFLTRVEGNGEESEDIACQL